MLFQLRAARSVPAGIAALLWLAHRRTPRSRAKHLRLRPGHRRDAPEAGAGRLADVAPDARRLGLQPSGPDRPRRTSATCAWSGRAEWGPAVSRPPRWPTAGCCTCPTRGTSFKRSTRPPAISYGSTAATCRTTQPPRGSRPRTATSPSTRNRIIDTSADGYVFALDAETGRQVWETQILDYETHPALQSSGPIIAGGKVISGRSCSTRGGPDACVIVAHDATTGDELWRRRTIPAPGEPGDETWGDVPFEERKHVGAWMVPELRSRVEPGLHRHVGHLAGAEVHARRRQLGAPLPQLDPGARRGHGRDRLVLPAPERPLGPRPPLRAHPRRHRGGAGSGGGELDQPAPHARRDAPCPDGHSRQDRPGLHPRPRDRRVPLGDSDRDAERHQRHRRRHRGGYRERRGGLQRARARRCWPAPPSSAARTGKPAPTAR